MPTRDDRERLLRIAQPYIRYYARRHHPPPPLDADDLYQVGMLAAWRTTDGWRGADTEYRNAAITVARSRMVDEIRRHRWGHRSGGWYSSLVPPTTIEQPLDGDGLTIGDTIEEPSRPEVVVDALDTLRNLDPRTRHMTVMRGLGFTLHEIAAKHGVSESRVSQLIGRRRAA